MLFRRFADLLSKPLLVSVPSGVTAGELQALWEAGVDSVVFELRVGQPQGGLKELRQAIDEIDFTSPRRRGKVEPLLPRISAGMGETAAEEEEEEEE